MTHSAFDLATQVVFRPGNISKQARDLRFLLLSLFLGLTFCGCFGVLLFLLNKQGRI